MHTVRLLLVTTEYDKQVIEKRFHAVSHIHNVLVKHAGKLLKRLSFNTEYQNLKKEYYELSKKLKLSETEKVHRKHLSTQMNNIIRNTGLSEYAFQSYIKVCGKQFSKCLSSQQVQKEASRVWAGVQKVLYGSGKEIHFKKYRDFDTISGKTNTNGIKFNKNEYFIEWLGLRLDCRIPKDSSYVMESLDSDISYCEIQRKMFPNGWHYYVIVYLKGDAPHKPGSTGNPDNIAGLDIGTSTVASVSDSMAVLKELAPECKSYNKRIERLLRSMDISRHMLNPKKYRPDGTIDKTNHDRWIYSKTYKKNLNRLKSLYRQKSAYIRQSHREMINVLLADSVNYIIEDMSFHGLQRKSKVTERSGKAAFIKHKNGSVKQVYKYKRKKRFGRSLNNRAPACFVELLEQKCMLYGGHVYRVHTKTYKASQYNHITDEYTKHRLDERFRDIGGHMVQRDLYSAFLLKNSNRDFTKPDRNKCIYGFDNFVRLHDKLISEMKNNGISMKQCFGF